MVSDVTPRIESCSCQSHASLRGSRREWLEGLPSFSAAQDVSHERRPEEDDECKDSHYGTCFCIIHRRSPGGGVREGCVLTKHNDH